MRSKTKLDEFLADPDPAEAYDVLCKVQELLDQDLRQLQDTLNGFLQTARRRVGHNSRTDEVSEAWNNAVERSFEEVQRAADSAFVDLVNRPEIDVDNLPPLRVITTEGESCIQVDCCECGKPLEIEKVRCGDCKEPEQPDKAWWNHLAQVEAEGKQDQQKLWEAVRTVERLVHCGCCHGSLETHDGHCPIAAVEALEMRLCNRFVEAEDLLDKLKRDLDKHKHSPDRAFLTYGTEDAERWHNKQHEAKVDGPGLEAFVAGLGTVRECIDCGCLVGGGPTRCKRCARDLDDPPLSVAMDAAKQVADAITKVPNPVENLEQQVDHLVENQKGFGQIMACMMNRLGVNEVEFSERQLAFVDPSDVMIENTTREGKRVIKVKLQAQLKAPTIDPRD